MILLLIRHGKAEPGIGKPDEERALTDEGREECRKFFGALHEFIGPLDYIASSPLLRAVETADILADFSPSCRRYENEALSPWGNPTTLESLFDQFARGEKSKKPNAQLSFALVSHEPFLSQATSFLLTGTPRPILEVRKAGVSILEFVGPTWVGGFCLQAHLFPKLFLALSQASGAA